MYFSGNLPSIVAGTLPATTSNGVGVTVKLSADNSPNFLHDVNAATAAKDKIKK
jgi:hypothetical protein